MLPGTEMEINGGIILELTDLLARNELTSRGAQLSMAPLMSHNFTQLSCLCDELSSMFEASCIPL